MDGRDVSSVLCVAAILVAAWFGRWGVVGVAIPIWVISVMASS